MYSPSPAHTSRWRDVRKNGAIALAAMDYFGELIPMSASFLADAELLAQYRQKMSQVAAEPVAGGPQKIEELLPGLLQPS